MHTPSPVRLAPLRPEATTADGHRSVFSTPLWRQEPYLSRAEPRHPSAKPSPAGPWPLLSSSLSPPTA